MCKNVKMFICLHMDTSVVLMSTNALRHMCISKCALTFHVSTHMFLCKYLRLFVFICMCTYAYKYLMNIHTSMPAFMCVLTCISLHIYIY